MKTNCRYKTLNIHAYEIILWLKKELLIKIKAEVFNSLQPFFSVVFT